MSDINYSGGPSRPKKRKTENDEALTDEEKAVLLCELSDEYPSDFSYDDSDDGFVPPSGAHPISDSDEDDDDDEEGIVQGAACQQDHSATVEKVIWENNSTSMEKFPFIKSECLLQPVSGKNPVDFFRHFLTDSILEEIVAQTNDYAHTVLFHRERKKSRTNAWKDTTKEELLVFVGLILHMGTVRMNRIQDYWETDSLFGIHAFPENMSRDRFLLLLRALHFSKIPEQNTEPPKDQLYKIRNMVNMFNARVSEIYYPGREISLDESMVLWRGRLMFRQYIPNKRHKYGIKLYMMTTPHGMVLKLLVHIGMLDDLSGKEHTRRVVMSLLEGMLDVGHSIFMDNYYSSYDLAKCLADRNTHCTGTIRKNRKPFPKEVKEKKLRKGETVAKYANGVMIGKWRDKRDVTYISNEYKNDMEDKTNKRGEIISKPLPVIEYNKCMTGIDKQDQILSYYPCERQTMRWPTKIFVHILQTMMNNSHFIYNKYSSRKTPLYDYRLSVIRNLLKQPSVVLRSPVCDQSETEHLLSIREEKKAGKVIRKQCKSCYSQGKRKDTIYICKACDGSPGYCLDCAKLIHK